MASGGAGGAGVAEASASRSIRASLLYTRDTGRRQKVYKGVEPPAGAEAAADRDTGEIVVDVDVADARRASPLPTLADHGFELIDSPTALTTQHFHRRTGRDLITSDYYAEVAEAIKAMTGAARVTCFHHQVRAASAARREALAAAAAREAAAAGAGAGAGAGAAAHPADTVTVEGPAPVVHADYSVRSATRMFQGMAPAGMRHGRFLVVNAWRNIASTPILDDHLAMCDARSVAAPDDFVLMDFVQPGSVSETYRLDPGHYTSHRWYYFPAMERSELLLFKQYDSDPRATARFAFHTSFTDRSRSRSRSRPSPSPSPSTSASASAASAAPCRESIEVRAIAFFPAFEPDTIPLFTVSGEERVHKAVVSILNSLSYGHKWGAEGAAWARGLLHDASSGGGGGGGGGGSSRGLDKMMEVMVAEGARKGHHELDLMDDAQRAEVLAALRGPQRATFEERAHASFPPLAEAEVEAAAVTSILRAVTHPEAWPSVGREWMRRALHAPGGVEATARQLVKGGAERGEYQLGRSTAEQRETVIAMLVSGGSYEEVAKAHFPPLPHGK